MNNHRIETEPVPIEAGSAVIKARAYIGEPAPLDPTTRWWSLNVHWWDSGAIFGPPQSDKDGGSVDVWASGEDFGAAVACAIRLVEDQGHRVAQVTVNP